MWPFKKKQPEKKEKHINGVTLGWDAKPHISFSDGTYFPTKVERIFHPEYFKNGEDWPRDPKTGEKLPIAD